MRPPIGAAWSGSAVPATRPTRGPATARRYSPTISHPSTPSAANSLPPFAMWPAFPASDYYGGFATSRPAEPTTNRPAADPEGRPTGTSPGRFPRSPHTGRRGRCPTLPLRHRHEYAADIPRGLPTGDFTRHRSRPPDHDHDRVGVHRTPAHIRQVGAGVSLERLLH